MSGECLGLGQAPPDLDNVGDCTLAEFADFLGMFGEIRRTQRPWLWLSFPLSFMPA